MAPFSPRPQGGDGGLRQRGGGGELQLHGALGTVHAKRRTPWIAIVFTSLLAIGLITFVGGVPQLGGTTALLLLCVFTVVNVAVLILRKDKVGHDHFRSPSILPILGAITCGFLVGAEEYIRREQLEIVSLYFAKERPCIERDGNIIMVDDDRIVKKLHLRPEDIQQRKIRFRTLGCYPLTGGIESEADTLDAIVEETLGAVESERTSRVIDQEGAGSMERRKREGYF